MYNEDDAIKFIREQIDPAIAALYDDDELLNVVDMIFDYYESNGMLDIDLDDPDDLEEPEELIDTITDYATRMLRKDKGASMDPAHLRPIIAAEIAYEDSLL